MFLGPKRVKAQESIGHGILLCAQKSEGPGVNWTRNLVVSD